MKTKFIDKGYGVVLGEYGVIARLNLGSASLNEEYEGYRKYYIQYITNSIFKFGLVPVYWDNGGTGNFGMGIFNRIDGSKAYPEIIKAIMDGVDTTNTTGMLDDQNTLPVKFSLSQNYPNPFNPETQIDYYIEEPGNVALKLYDTLGREIATLVDELKQPGNYSFRFSANNFKLASGVYFYKLTSGNFSDIKRMIYLK
jgi:hypothetical protein